MFKSQCSFIVILLGLFSSCNFQKNNLSKNNFSEKRIYSTSNPIFFSIMEDFEEDASIHISPSFSIGDISINFGDVPNDAAGVCYIYKNGQKEIFISQKFWSKGSPMQKKILIYHELGHCRLNRSHDDSFRAIDDMTIKNSIMHSTIPSTQEFMNYKSYYLEELYI